MCEVEVWILMDEEGQHVVNSDPDALAELFADEYGSPGGPMRLLKVCLNVAPPVHVELCANVPTEKVGPITMTVKEA